MAHKITVKHRRIKITEEPEALEILDRPKFVQSHNYRTVIGIYPRPYDFSTNYTEEQLEADPSLRERKGFIYDCYRVESDFKRVQYHEIPDWDLKTLDDGKLKGSIADMIYIIVFDKQYETEIAEQSFMDSMTSVISQIVPSRLKVSFSIHPHVKL